MSMRRRRPSSGPVRPRARRRVRMRSALLLTLGAGLCTALLRALTGTGRMPYAACWLLELGAALLCFGGGAYLGLCVLDGDHCRLVPARALTRAQTLHLCLLGALAVCPASLARDIVMKLMGGVYGADGFGAMDSRQFVQTLLRSALIAPVCEELFFRGYLYGAFRRYGRLGATALVSLCFALVHAFAGAPGSLTAYALLGALLCLVTERTRSILAPVLVHACYNAALIVLSHLGLSALLMGWSFAACAVRLAGCAAFAAALRRAYTARGTARTLVLWEGGALSRREKALLIACAALLALLLALGG